MKFTYDAYHGLLELLRQNRYCFETYHTWHTCVRCVILRHDVDTSLEKALEMAEFEASLGVKSTYFVLLRTDFYNPASQTCQRSLRRIHGLGHEIGLHFDEKAYEADALGTTAERIQSEAEILSHLCGFPITAVSMHRPSQATLESNLEIPGMVNSYGQTFFHDFKYLSDSRRNWREPVLDIIQAGTYDRLHILTHAFWYHPQEENISQTVATFVNGGNSARYAGMRENMTDLNTILKESEVR